MKAAYLVNNGRVNRAFEIRDLSIQDPQPHEVQISVQAFGLNFADVMARLGLYPDAPKKPGILGYDVVGTILDIGSEVRSELSIGDYVVALTRFGGYGQLVNTDYRAAVKISSDIPVDVATAFATQGGTAYYMAREMVNIFPGDHVLVHAAAGGVGSLSVQMAKSAGATVYGTASTSAKLDYITSIGVDHPINYKEHQFADVIRKILGKDIGLDIIFDPIGGMSVRRGYRLLGAGGRIVLCGASSLTSAKYIWSKLGVVKGFGLFSPIALLNPSKSLIGVNMLRIADDKPEVLQRVIRGAVDMYEDGVIQPLGGGIYSISELAVAHQALEKRKTMGKLAVKW